VSPNDATFVAVNSEVAFMFTVWFLSLYFMTVFPGVMSIDSPGAALET
jgi:hypothetical protein